MEDRALESNAPQAQDRLETQVRQADDVPVLDVQGEIDIFTAPRFKDAVGAAAQHGEHIIINMAGVTYMDSSGFGMLLSATKQLRPAGGSIHLVGCNDVICRMLEITRLNTIFRLHASENDALEAIPQGARTNGHQTNGSAVAAP